MPDLPTKHVRITGDLADMLGWLAEIEGPTIAEIIDPLIRKAVEQRYARIKPAVQRLERMKSKKREPAGATHELGESGA